MFSTPVGYRLIASDISAALDRTAAKPEVTRESEYYLSKIGDFDSIEQFMADDRIYQFAMRAHGLDDMIYAKAFMRKVLSEGIDATGSFANSLADARFRDFAETFNFARYGSTATTFTRTQRGTVDNYVRQALEVEQGDDNEGIRLALYFERKAPAISSAYSLLADRALLKVTQVALGMAESTGALDIDRQAELIADKLDLADLKDPEKLDKLLTRFTALWEIDNPSSVTAQSSTDLLFGGIGGGFDADLLTSIQNYKAGR
ncbi:MAG: DUF1217 domain-containing protein [Hyphomicrobiaceae bacterium]|nr:DUF1217 domain-containing protein [Hyphomicrobiaceae bacterium]